MYRTLATILAILLAVVTPLVAVISAVEFTVCPAGHAALLSGSELTSVLEVKSAIGCGQQCAQTPPNVCASFNLCPSSSAALQCQMISENVAKSCSNSSGFVDQVDCRYGYRMLPPTTTTTATTTTTPTTTTPTTTTPPTTTPTTTIPTTTTPTTTTPTTTTPTTTTPTTTTPTTTTPTTTTPTTTTTPATTTPACQNGGTRNNLGNCTCTIQYSGKYCERYIRDCTEAFENGYNTPNLSGVYWIQPVSAPAPFRVTCQFEYGGMTHPYSRTQVGTVNFTCTYAQCLEKFGDVPSTPEDFFVGLYNMHYLLKQAQYEVNMYSAWAGYSSSASVIFQNFTIGNEASGFVVNFVEVNVPAVTVEFSQGMTFSTPGHVPPTGCLHPSGNPGWYWLKPPQNVECQGNEFLFGNPLRWRVNGVPTAMDITNFNAIRYGKFYNNA